MVEIHLHEIKSVPFGRKLKERRRPSVQGQLSRRFGYDESERHVRTVLVSVLAESCIQRDNAETVRFSYIRRAENSFAPISVHAAVLCEPALEKPFAFARPLCVGEAPKVVALHAFNLRAAVAFKIVGEALRRFQRFEVVYAVQLSVLCQKRRPTGVSAVGYVYCCVGKRLSERI